MQVLVPEGLLVVRWGRVIPHPSCLRRMFAVQNTLAPLPLRKDLPVITGTCLCGAVSLEIDEPLEKAPEACHCSQCRKQTGNFFVGVNVRRTAMRVAGEERVTWYPSSEKVRRGFCSTCGSVLFWKPTIAGYEWDWRCAGVPGHIHEVHGRQAHLCGGQGQLLRDHRRCASVPGLLSKRAYFSHDRAVFGEAQRTHFRRTHV